RGDQYGGDRAGGKAERQHGHEGAGRGRVVRRFWSGNAGDRALTEFFRVLGDAPLDRGGQEARNDVGGAGGGPEQKAEHGAAGATGMADCRHSCRFGRSWRSLGAITLPTTAADGVDRISPSPNRPIATGTMPIPSPSSAMSKE